MASLNRLSPPVWSWRRAVILSALILLVGCLYYLGLDFNQLPPSADPHAAANSFFSAALQPAIADQNPSLPADAAPFLSRVSSGLLTTIRYAFIAMSLALPAGLILGFLSSRAWWPQTTRSQHPGIGPLQILRSLFGLLYLSTRFISTLIRSIHELIWVMLFMAFLGDSPLTACIALALPFTGTLAKVFSELIDEQSHLTSQQLRLSGASSLQSFLLARLPQALPDLLTYTMYRLECAIRSSAVLGFIGIETIGLAIKQSYDNKYYAEVWTELYALIAVVMLFDILGSSVRKRLHKAPQPLYEHHQKTPLKTLRRQAPRWKFLRFIWPALLVVTSISWFCGEPLNQYHSHVSRWERTQKFFHNLTPEPVRISYQWTDAIPWIQDLWDKNGQQALFSTTIMATTALLLAALFGYLCIPWASRNIATALPFGLRSGSYSKLKSTLWRLMGSVMRLIFLVSRSIPEFIIAFLLIGILGAHAWPLIIALAIHNFGILGRLWSEINENHNENAAKQQTLRGATRQQAFIFGLFPTSFNRQILFLFYRWETCVRESTILGMLSISSLGYFISLEASFLRYDSMLFYILLGTAIIFISDLVSISLRARLNRH